MPRHPRATLFPKGVGNTATALLAAYPQLDPFKIVAVEDDFYGLDLTRWNVVEAGTGTQAVADGHGGRLVLTTGALDNNLELLRGETEAFLLSKTKRSWFRTKLQISHATDAEFYAGLAVSTDDDPFAGGLPAPGIGFHLVDGSAAVNFHMKDTGTAVAVTTGIATVVAATDIELGWFYDPIRGTVTLYVNDAPVYALADNTEYPDSEAISVVLGVKAGSAAARSINVDYVLAATER